MGQEFDPWSGKIPGEGNGNPLLYSCLENPMDRGAWRATVHVVAESDTTEVTQHARREDPTRCGAMKPAHRNYWAWALEAMGCNCWGLRT